MQKSIYIISTGGTIAMQKTKQGYAPMPGHLEKSMAKIPELKNPDMPSYTIYEYAHPIDSANMTPLHWMQIGEDILKNYDKYTGFVVLHGTDTMAYTASALSFMLENLNKPVIFTGSQLPLFMTRNDARENLINALLLACDEQLTEVCVYFNNKLFRGNRTKKMDASSFAAFASPNFPTLAKIGIDMRVRHDLIFKNSAAPLSLQMIQPNVIGALRIFPGISLEMLKLILRQPLVALVLETYGLGNAPEEPAFLAILQEAVQRGIIIVNCSQCPYAKVRMREYATGLALQNVGVISGADMTAEAALAKLFYLYSKNLGLDDIKKQISLSLRGELT